MWPPGRTSRAMLRKPPSRIARVVQHAVAEHDVELLGPERGAEQVHLQEAHAGEPVLAAELLGHPQRVHAQVRPDHGAAADAEEVRELAGAAAHLEHPRIERDLLAQQARVDALARLRDQRAHGVVVVVVRERVLLVELLHDLGDVALGLLVGPEELPDPVLAAEACAAAAAAGGRTVDSESPAAGGAAPELRAAPDRARGRPPRRGAPRGPRAGPPSPAPSSRARGRRCPTA